MIHEIIFAGSGGQGIMLIGKILAQAGMFDNKNVTWFPAYGAEMRGGTANCSVVISDQHIGSPIISRPWAAIAMNQPSLEKFEGLIKPRGFLLINSSLSNPMSIRNDIEILSLPVTEIADNLGTTKVANIIALSCFCVKTGIVSWRSLEKAMEETFLLKDNSVSHINFKALYTGRDHVQANKAVDYKNIPNKSERYKDIKGIEVYRNI